MGKDNKDAKDGKDTKAHKDDRGQRFIDKALDAALDSVNSIDNSGTLSERMARAAKSSDLLSMVWSLPPAQRLMFHAGVRVDEVDTAGTPGFEGGREDGERFIDISSSEIARFQKLLYANGVKGVRRRLLIVLQGMDASGKGGIVRHVFRQGDPMGIHYHGFGKPSEEELAHDFLWRVRRELPQPGWIAVFDRSHYEDVVMPHVYGTYPEDVWRARRDQPVRTRTGDRRVHDPEDLPGGGPRRAEAALPRSPGGPDQVLEIRRERSGRPRTLGRVYGGLAGGVREDVHPRRPVVSGSRR